MTLQKLIDEGYDPLDYRYFLLGGHYRSQLQFSWDSLAGAKNARKSLLDKIRGIAGKTDKKTDSTSTKNAVNTLYYIQAFNKALEDDLNTPRALAELWGLLRDGSVAPNLALEAAFDMDEALGLGLKASVAVEKQPEDAALVQEIEGIIAERAEAKKAKDFARADSLRQSLKERGIALVDGPGGTTWHRI